MIINDENTPLLYSHEVKQEASKSSDQSNSRNDVQKNSASSTVITYHNISYNVRVKFEGQKVNKAILKDLHGIMKPGANAILGPTGSGKTTLLDILAGRKDPRHLTGVVLVNGNLQPKNFKCASGYVVQDDVVMGTLTVRENLNFSAALRLPQTLSKKKRYARVNDILRDLGLMNVADQKVGTDFIRGISGGERKRTTIGMELITAPSVLFLDEPTTGLDASTACSVISLLHALGKRGKTIIFSIHQPRYSIYKLFDTMTMLSDGEIVYQGPTPNALQYFDSIGYTCEEHNNPPDFFMDVINENVQYKAACVVDSSDLNIASVEGVHSSSKKINDLAESYRKSSYFVDVMNTVGPILGEFHSRAQGVGFTHVDEVSYAKSFFEQLYYVSGRAVKNLLRNPHASIMQLVITLIFGCVVGAIYYDQKKGQDGLQNRVGAFFFIVMNMVFGNLSAVELFIKERKIFIHESAGGYYQVSVYFLAKVLCDLLPMRLIPITAFSAIVYFMVGFRATVEKFFIFALTLVLTSLCACGYSFFISASVTTFAIANLLIALPYVFMMVFSGVLVNLRSVGKWLSWIKYISIFKYAIEALEANELEGMVFHCHNNTSCPSGDDYLRQQGVKPSELWYNELALGVMACIYMLFAYIALRLVKKEK